MGDATSRRVIQIEAEDWIAGFVVDGGVVVETEPDAPEGARRLVGRTLEWVRGWCAGRGWWVEEGSGGE